jgi:hypothetical protein
VGTKLRRFGNGDNLSPCARVKHGCVPLFRVWVATLPTPHPAHVTAVYDSTKAVVLPPQRISVDGLEATVSILLYRRDFVLCVSWRSYRTMIKHCLP